MSDVRAGAIVCNIAHSCTLPLGVLLIGISRGEDANADGHADIQRSPYASRYDASSVADWFAAASATYPSGRTR
jgi:hypothetical protein